MEPLGLLEKQADAWGLSLDSKQVDSLLRYARLLVEYEKANVIGTRDVYKVLTEHVLDSLSCSVFSPLSVAGRLVDVGSGGGMPGVPLKIVFPDVQAALLESSGKKASFLKYVVEELALEDTRVLNERAEDLGGREVFRESFEVATARALAPLSVLVEYCLPLLRIGGFVISMKARLSEEEMESGKRAARTLGGRVRETIKVPFLEEIGLVERQLVIVEKLCKTPKNYPRRAGMPKKRPLGGAK